MEITEIYPHLKNFFVKSIHIITLKWKNTLTEFLLKSRGEKLITTLCYIIGACMQSEFSQFPHLEMNTHNGVFGKGIDSPGTFLYQPFTKEFRESTSYFSKVYRYIRPRRKLKSQKGVKSNINLLKHFSSEILQNQRWNGRNFKSSSSHSTRCSLIH